MRDMALELSGTIFETSSAKKIIARKTVISSTIFSPDLAGKINPTMLRIDKNKAFKKKLYTKKSDRRLNINLTFKIG